MIMCFRESSHVRSHKNRVLFSIFSPPPPCNVVNDMRKCCRSQIGMPQIAIVVIVSCRWRHFQIDLSLRNVVVVIIRVRFYDFANLGDDSLEIYVYLYVCMHVWGHSRGFFLEIGHPHPIVMLINNIGPYTFVLPICTNPYISPP